MATHHPSKPSIKRNDFSEMATIDPSAVERLQAEITRVHAAGYDISVGARDDPAYDSPQKITDIYRYLRDLDVKLLSLQHDVIRRGLGFLGVNPLVRAARRRQRIDHALEPSRIEWLYGPIGAIPWHNQRGRAAALLAIVSAHSMMIGRDKKTGTYATMSGPLSREVLSYVFDERAGWLNGLSVESAAIRAGTRFGNRDEINVTEQVRARLDDLDAYLDAPASSAFCDIIRYCTDGLGIRARQTEVHRALDRHVREKKLAGQDECIIMSFGCGTALPILEITRDLKKTHGISPRLILLDQDPIALAAAACLAEKMGLADAIEIHCERLFNRFGRPMKLDRVLQGRKLDIAEDSGLREYLPSMIYRWLTRETWHALKPGGLMATGNMNQNRPQAEFLTGMMGWLPRVRMRTIKTCLSLHQHAGVPRACTRVCVTADGVYSMYFTVKPS